MTALPALPSNASAGPASKPSGVPGPGQSGKDSAANDAGPVDFASLVTRAAPSGDQFAALQRVKAALDASTEDALPASDVGALLAEISLPLAPSTIPLSPIAQTAQSLLSTAAEAANAPLGRTDRGALVRVDPKIQAGDDLAADADNPSLAFDRHAVTPKGEFKLPETSALAVAQALTSPTHVAGPTASHAPGGQALLASNLPVHSPQWSSELGQNMVWMARQGVQTAQLAINPSHLGPIEITLSLHRDHATAHFVSAHAEIRDIIEQSLPRLKEIMDGAGVQLGQTDVGAQSRQQQFSGNTSNAQGEIPVFGLDQATFGAKNAVDDVVPPVVQRGNGLVDTFA